MKNTRKSRLDPLEEVQLKIARRADELAASSRPRTALNLHWWSEAEREVLGHSPSLFATAPSGGSGEPQLAGAY